MSIDYSKLYNFFMKMHAQLPYTFTKGFAFSPLRISLMVTYKCNLNCRMCFQSRYRERNLSYKELSFDEIIRIINQTPRYTLLTWTGGEPFLRPDMVEILRYAGRRNPCNILTNATLLDDEKIKAIVDSRVRLLGVSIDGIGTAHDIIRGRKGCFEDTVAAIRLLQEYKIQRQSRFPLLDIKTMVLKENIDQIQRLVDIAVELHADFLTMSFPFGEFPFNPDGEQRLSKFIHPCSAEDADIKDLLNRLQLLDTRGTPLRLRLYPDMTFEKSGEYAFNPTILSQYQSCKMPWSHLWISPIGQVFPCLPYEIGNVRTATLKELWNNERFRVFRQVIKNQDVVPGCTGCCYLKQK